MQNKDSLIDELTMVESFHEFAQVYEEISVMRMQRIRQKVLRNRLFQEKLAEVYYDVKQSYETEVLAVEAKKKKKKNPIISILKRKKNLAILLTSSGRMYGDIFNKVFHLFKEHVTTQDCDVLIIGRLGKQKFDDSKIKKKCIYFDLPDREIKHEDLNKIIEVLVKYDNINVFFGRFDNIMIQKPEMTNITGDTVEQLKSSIFDTTQAASNAANQAKPVQFIFEPSLENVLHFFDTQVFASLFKQSIHESDLARFASRIQAMEKASVHIEQRIKSISNEILRVDKLVNNKKQIERISGISIWNK